MKGSLEAKPCLLLQWYVEMFGAGLAIIVGWRWRKWHVFPYYYCGIYCPAKRYCCVCGCEENADKALVCEIDVIGEAVLSVLVCGIVYWEYNDISCGDLVKIFYNIVFILFLNIIVTIKCVSRKRDIGRKEANMLCDSVITEYWRWLWLILMSIIILLMCVFPICNNMEIMCIFSEAIQ